MGVSDKQTENSHKSSQLNSKKTPPHLLSSFQTATLKGRFAPSPTGPLHFGSLIAATASYLCVRQSPDSKWLLRIEDIDTQRTQKGATQSIIETLESYGFAWDGEIVYQTQRNDAYQAALETISKHVYNCSCTRKELRELSAESKYSYTYPGFCRNGIKNPVAQNRSTRLLTNQTPVCFSDQCQTDEYCQNIEKEVGDFIVKRSDGLFAYQLAVVVDDAWQQINQIVRGSDLFDNTPRQIYLQRLLGYPQPEYLHIPVVVDATGKKFSKQNLSAQIPSRQKRATLIKALDFLGQKPPKACEFSSLDDLWQWAVQNWDINRIPKVMIKYYEYE